MTKGSTISRNLNIDVIKIIAMYGVVCWHSTRQFVDLESERLTPSSILYRTAVISIPLFFMVSGYLQFGKDNITYKYSLNKILNIFRFIIIISLGYYGISGLINGFQSISLYDTLLNTFFGEGPFYVFWYLNAMIIIYIIAPLLKRIHQREVYFVLVTVALLLIQNIAFLHNLTIGGGDENTYITLRLYNWITFFMIGGFFIKNKINFQRWNIIVLILLVSNILFQYALIKFVHAKSCSFYYSSPIVAALSVSIFLLILQLRLHKYNGLITQLSRLFLPIFAFHSFFIPISTKLSLNFGYLTPIVCFFLTAILTTVSCWVLMRLPYADKIFKI